MTVSLLIADPTRAKIGALELDASLRETHSARNEVTQHPVERGSAVSDHIRPLPDGLVIEGVVSNAPLARPGLVADSAENVTRADSAYLQLLELRNSGQLVTVTTKRRTYTNMALTDLTVPGDASIGDALQFTATFVQVTVVDSRTVELSAQTLGGLGKQKKGKKATVPAPEPLRVSAAKTLTNYVGTTAVGSGVDRSGALGSVGALFQ